MKKITLLFLLLTVSILKAQPIITTVIDGDCSGGTPKGIEIYAKGTVDFSLYTLQLQANANTTWSGGTVLTDLGTVTDKFVYVMSNADGVSHITTEFSLTSPITLISSAVNHNGDDRMRIILTSNSTVIDLFGVDGEDGTGKDWETLDSYAKRKSGTSASATFNSSDWTFGGPNFLDGSCGTLASKMTIGDYQSSVLGVQNVDATKLKVTSANGVVSANTGKIVAVYNTLGQKVANENLKGIYIVKVVMENQVKTVKVFVN